jgi:hypothetical protein
MDRLEEHRAPRSPGYMGRTATGARIFPSSKIEAIIADCPLFWCYYRGHGSETEREDRGE